MGSPPTALDSLVQLRARETRVRRLPPAYSLSSTSSSLRGGRKSIFGTAGYAGSPNPKGGKRWTRMKPDESLMRASSGRIWTPATQTWKQGQLFQKRQKLPRKTFGTLI